MGKPITPKELIAAKAESFPGVVFDIFNAAIADAWDGERAIIRQGSVAMSVANALQIPVEEVYKRFYMDVEPFYCKAGWKVKYDKPGIGDNYEAYYEFKRKRSILR